MICFKYVPDQFIDKLECKTYEDSELPYVGLGFKHDLVTKPFHLVSATYSLRYSAKHFYGNQLKHINWIAMINLGNKVNVKKILNMKKISSYRFIKKFYDEYSNQLPDDEKYLTGYLGFRQENWL